MIHTPRKTRHDFHLAKAGSPYKLFVRGTDELPKGMRWYKDVVAIIAHNIDTDDRWISEDNVIFTPLNDKPVRTIIRKGQGKEVIAIFTHDYVWDNNKKEVNIWSSVRGFYAARPNAVFAQTDDYDGTRFEYWVETIANVSGRVIRTVNNLE